MWGNSGKLQDLNTTMKIESREIQQVKTFLKSLVNQLNKDPQSLQRVF
jgi:uncharacterized protein YegL